MCKHQNLWPRYQCLLQYRGRCVHFRQGVRDEVSHVTLTKTVGVVNLCLSVQNDNLPNLFCSDWRMKVLRTLCFHILSYWLKLHLSHFIIWERIFWNMLGKQWYRRGWRYHWHTSFFISVIRSTVLGHVVVQLWVNCHCRRSVSQSQKEGGLS
jgi:hypothetical protein